MRSIPVLMFAIVSLAGCGGRAGTPSILNDDLVNQIQIGTTTKEQVEQLLGPPSSRHSRTTAGATTEIWAYAYAESSRSPLLMVPGAGLLAMGAGHTTSSQSRSLGIVFDRRGVVQSLSRSLHGMKGGALFQPAELTSETATQSAPVTVPVLPRSETAPPPAAAPP